MILVFVVLHTEKSKEGEQKGSPEADIETTADFGEEEKEEDGESYNIPHIYTVYINEKKLCIHNNN